MGRSDFVIFRTVILCYTVVLHLLSSLGVFHRLHTRSFGYNGTKSCGTGRLRNQFPLSRWCYLAPFTLTLQHSLWRKPPDSAEGGRAIRPVITNQSLLLLPEPVAEHRWQTKQWFCSVIELLLGGETEMKSFQYSALLENMHIVLNIGWHTIEMLVLWWTFCEHQML